MPDLAIPWQARFLRGLRRPGVRTAALSIGRSNGKSWLAARLAADYLTDGAPDSECVIVASSYTQALVIFHYVTAMAEAAGEALGDRSRWQFQDSSTTALIRNRSTGRAVRALGCDPRRAHGRKFGLALLDEPAQWPPGTRDSMLSAIRTGAGKVEGSKIVALGTRSDDPTHWFSEWLGGVADYSQLHAARPNDPPYQLRTIRRANPAYDYLPALREALHSQRDEARSYSTARYAYRALALNLGTSDRPESVLLDPADWERCETDLPPARDGAYILAFDMGGASAMTAASGFWPLTHRAEVMAVIGGVPSLAERGRADNVGPLYRKMADRGELLVSEGRKTPDVFEFACWFDTCVGSPNVEDEMCERVHTIVDAMRESGEIGWKYSTVRKYRSLAAFEWEEIARCGSLRKALEWCANYNRTPAQRTELKERKARMRNKESQFEREIRNLGVKNDVQAKRIKELEEQVRVLQLATDPVHVKELEGAVASHEKAEKRAYKKVDAAEAALHTMDRKLERQGRELGAARVALAARPPTNGNGNGNGRGEDDGSTLLLSIGENRVYVDPGEQF